jgi:DNA-directed RNA polymerase beta' subunit
VSLGEGAGERINDYDAVRIALAGPDEIRSWSWGEVKDAKAIDYQTFRPARDGLFCERIFGPEKDWECACGKYKGSEYKGAVCDQCGVEVTRSLVRFQRFGHIELSAPVVHAWFFKRKPSRLGTLLNMSTQSLERIIYFRDYVVVDPGGTPFRARQLLTEDEFRRAKEQYSGDGQLGGSFDADIGALAIRKLLMRLDLVALATWLRLRLAETSSTHTIENVTRRLKVVEALLHSGVRPEWMVLDCIPVIPPGLRPLRLLSTRIYALSEMYDFYKLVINYSRRVVKLHELSAPEVIIRNIKRGLQKSVDALFDNSRRKRPILDSFNRPMKSLTDMITGKHRRLRADLLSKRVDFSASSVIVVDPNLTLYQCGLPRKIALELFQPFVIRRLKELRHFETIVSCKQRLNRPDRDLWDVLDQVVRNHPVLLSATQPWNRMGIQAFEPVLVDGNAIHVHPLVCNGLKVGFDGVEIAVHLPLSIEAQVEAMTLMMATCNFLSPANGKPIFNPTPDIVAGLCYLTVSRQDETGSGMIFANASEVLLARSQGEVGAHARIKLRLPAHKRLRGDGEKTFRSGTIIETTVGRVVFNDILHARLPFYNLVLGQSQLEIIIADCDQMIGRGETIALLDRTKELGFRELTRSGFSVGIDDLNTASSADAMTGRAANLEDPIEANFRTGLSMHEYIGTASGVRRELYEKAVRNARSRKLAGKLAEVAQNAVVTTEDCGTSLGIRKSAINEGKNVEITLAQSVRGRVSRVDILDPITQATVVRANEMITPAAAKQLEELHIANVQVRSPMTCEAPRGVCRLCYGMDLAGGQMVELGAAVGIIAAQSIGEAGNHFTMRKFQRGAGEPQHMTGGLLRVTELFEARRPREPAVIAEIDGLVELLDYHPDGKRTIIIRSETGVEHKHRAPLGKCLRVQCGDRVRAGDPLIEGPLAPHDVLRVSGQEAVGRYLLRELQNVYRSYRVEIDDKHLEIIIARMLRTVRVKSAGDTSLLPGSVIDKFELRRVNQELMTRLKVTDRGDTDFCPGDLVTRERLDEENVRAQADGGRKAESVVPKPAVADGQLLGITKAAMVCEGFIALASVRRTTKVLTEAALCGKVDNLVGLKENVIVGHLIPAGTGFEAYVRAPVRMRPESVGALTGKELSRRGARTEF